MAQTCIIGLGAMGLGMARNVIGAGIALRGYDIAEAARARFSMLGGHAFDTAAAAAAGCDLALVMVVNAAQAKAALFDSGVAGALAPGAVVVLSSTVAPREAREIAAALEAVGHQMLDAPVSGGQVGAEAGTLTVMASGPEAAFARAADLLQAVAGKLHRLGEAPGMGATYKVVHQLAAGVHLAAAAELMALGEKAGCDPETLFDIVTHSAGQSWMLENRGPRMMMENPPVTSSVDIFIKDMGLVLDTGREAGVRLPLASAAFEMFQAAAALGHGREDDSQVIRAYTATDKAIIQDI